MLLYTEGKEFRVNGKYYAVSRLFRGPAAEKLIRPKKFVEGSSSYLVCHQDGIVWNKVFEFQADDNRTDDEVVDMAYILVCNTLGVDAGSADAETVKESEEEDGMQEQAPDDKRKARQAAYTAKHREKAKAMRRPEHRDVEKGYMVVVESDDFIDYVKSADAYYSKQAVPPAVAADQKARAIVQYVRAKVMHDLTQNRGFDLRQVQDKLDSMVAPKLTA